MFVNFLNDAMKKEYGRKMYKLALSGGMTCPNRDGTLGTHGCIFCSEHGSGEFAEDVTADIDGQIERAIARVKNKAKNAGYIGYFQSFTNTYAPVSYLRRLFYSVIEHPDIDILSIATRPDCLSDETVSLLSELNAIKPVWVELGLQTVDPDTARYIRRGYELSVFDDAVKRLKSAGMTVIVHMIIGLPYETDEDMVKTARYIGNCGADGIKLQLLHVLKGTDLADEYARGVFSALTLERYTEILIKCIKVLPPDMVAHRITGDGDKKLLIAPDWSKNKKAVLNYIHKALRDQNIVQGSDYGKDDSI